MSAATVPQVLRDAAELIERRRHDLWNSPSGATVLWLIDAVEERGGGREHLVAAQRALAQHLELSPIVSLSIREWEETKGRTESEVLAALRGAADAWEAEHG